MTIDVRAGDQLLGELVIRKGSVSWRAGGAQYVFKMGWERFDEMMQKHGRPQKQL
jgi:hypothetical protein